MMLAILQARVSSTRLPGKVLKPILGVPMLMRQVERVRRACLIDRLVVATSSDDSDDPIEAMCRNAGLSCFRGSLEDVLDRFYHAASEYRPEHVVRLTGDCPLTDPAMIDEVVGFYRDGEYDYASNAIQATFPDGLDVEVFRFRCLEETWREARLRSEREHVTPFLYRQPERFKLGHFKQPADMSSLRWTVDEPADFDFVRQVYEALYPCSPAFDMNDVLRLLEAHPELAAINHQFQRNEGYFKSLADDGSTNNAQ